MRKDHPGQFWLKMAQRFKRRRFKCRAS